MCHFCLSLLCCLTSHANPIVVWYVLKFAMLHVGVKSRFNIFILILVGKSQPVKLYLILKKIVVALSHEITKQHDILILIIF